MIQLLLGRYVVTLQLYPKRSVIHELLELLIVKVRMKACSGANTLWGYLSANREARHLLSHHVHSCLDEICRLQNILQLALHAPTEFFLTPARHAIFGPARFGP